MDPKKETTRIELPARKQDYEVWIRGKSEGNVEERLRDDFKDTLNNRTNPAGGIIIGLDNNLVVGIPYRIFDSRLEIGPFAVYDPDYRPRSWDIPLNDILAYQRFELPKNIRIGGAGAAYEQFDRSLQLISTKGVA